MNNKLGITLKGTSQDTMGISCCSKANRINGEEESERPYDVSEELLNLWTPWLKRDIEREGGNALACS